MGSVPPNAKSAGRLIDQRLKARSEKPGEQRTLTVEYRETPEILPVISLPVDSLVLNPDTHRIRAQKSLDMAREKHLRDEPYGEEGQSYLQYLLTRDPANPDHEDSAFKELKESLKQYGQEEPGIVTRSGVLINGNTRCVALRELHKQQIEVAVLPSDAGDADTEAIELVLQLRKEHKREYSFVNHLLAIDGRISRGDSPSDIKRDFRIQQSTYDRSIWILQQIRNVIERSKVALESGEVASLRLVDFEVHQGKLEELYRAWSRLTKRGKHDEAARLVEQRMLATAMEKSKTDARLIDENFLTDYASSILPRADAEPSTISIPGVPGGLAVAGPSSKARQVAAVNDTALKSRAVKQAADKANADELAKSSKDISRIEQALESALTVAGKNSRLKRTQNAPIQSLEDATEDIRSAVTAIAASRAVSAFDVVEIDDALKTFKAELTRLAQHIRPTIDNPTIDSESQLDGATWLFKAVAEL